MPEREESLSESLNELVISTPKSFDLHFGSAREITLSGYEGDSMQIRLTSAANINLDDALRVKIEETDDVVDVHIKRDRIMSKEQAEESVTVRVMLPLSCLRKIELSAAAPFINLDNLKCETIELDVNSSEIVLKNTGESVEIDCNHDVSVICSVLQGYLAINQVSASSRIYIPEGTSFQAIRKGIKTEISYEKNGEPCDPFETANAENSIELNGFKSHLTICEVAKN